MKKLTIRISVVFELFLATFFFPNLFAASPKSFTGIQHKILFESREKVSLQENLKILDEIYRFEYIGNNQFIILTRQGSCVIYDLQGTQMKSIDRIGNGPLEFLLPYAVSACKDTIVIWDATKLKYVFFSKNGTPLNEITGFSEAIADFVYANHTIIMYFSGEMKDDYLGFYDTQSRKLAKTLERRNSRHDLLMFMHGSGGLALKNNVLYYASPAEDVINILDLKTFNTQKIPINAPDFEVKDEKIELRSRADLKKIENYLKNNGRVTGIYTLDDFLVTEIETGRIIDETRATKIFVHDYTYKYIDMVELNFSTRKELGERIAFVAGNKLFFMSTASPDEGITIERTLRSFEIVRVSR